MNAVYYNDNDKKNCAWLRELMADGLIPQGDVDDRSILEIEPHEITHYTQRHFFAGIGGWAYALRLAQWPDDWPCDTGSCPCQPLSCAGLRKGHADERHLWPAFYQLIAQCQPPTIFGEQIASKDGREWLAGVRADLEGLGYALGCADLCAAGVGAPNIRQRLFWVAQSESKRGERTGDSRFRRNGPPNNCGAKWLGKPNRERLSERERNGGLQPETLGSSQGQAVERTMQSGRMGKPNGSGPQQGSEPATPMGHGHSAVTTGFWHDSYWHWCRDEKYRRVPAQPEIFPLAARIPSRVGLLRGAGNAINPEIAAQFIRASMEAITEPTL